MVQLFAIILAVPSLGMRAVNDLIEQKVVPTRDLAKARKAKKQRKRNQVLHDAQVPVVLSKNEVKQLQDPKTNMDERGEILARGLVRKRALADAA